ncbi:hypothetical protein PF008_g31440 [Phytophthora fragariae]|uniref:Uncharacterized protein n=1 Tax=Phytophthora fragariae TaxID=53985 RepID=A0A6G0Q3E9_9STRA|nr:hypothetical protein PF008_g31440 [Phytophthora fragariae]
MLASASLPACKTCAFVPLTSCPSEPFVPNRRKRLCTRPLWFRPTRMFNLRSAVVIRPWAVFRRCLSGHHRSGQRMAARSTVQASPCAELSRSEWGL